MDINLISKNENDTKQIATLIASNIFKGALITLKGDLGAGKTTFTKGIGEALGIKEEINSPTFNILKCYFHSPMNLYHIDAYRLEDVPSENKNIGLEEVIEDPLGITVIEWPMFISELFDENKALNIEILINKEDTSRQFHIESKNEKFKNIFEVLKNEYVNS